MPPTEAGSPATGYQFEIQRVSRFNDGLDFFRGTGKHDGQWRGFMLARPVPAILLKGVRVGQYFAGDGLAGAR